MEDILKKDGLSLELLGDLSYQSGLGIRLKKNLHYFNREESKNYHRESVVGYQPRSSWRVDNLRIRQMRLSSRDTTIGRRSNTCFPIRAV